MKKQPDSAEGTAPPDAAAAVEAEAEAEARRLKSLAEEKIRASSIKSALKYARRASRLSPELEGIEQMVIALKILRASPSDHYRILRIEPFSHINAVKKQYKALALALHPDKSSSSSSASLLPAAEEAFKRVADSFRFLSDRALKKDFDLRLRLELAAKPVPPPPAVETFWTACTKCRLLHEFDRRYVGHRLICPVCRKSFLAVEVPSKEASGDAHDSYGLRPRITAARSRSNTRPRIPNDWFSGKRKAGAFLESAPSEPKKPKQKKEKTLAQLQLELTAAKKGKDRRKDKEKEEEEGEKKGKEIAIVTLRDYNGDDLSLMAVEDSDFYDFDKDRTEKSFSKGQVWAIYDDDDGMPRHYGLIDEVISSNPFKVKMSWLDLQSNGDVMLVLREKSGYHVSCGRFKVSRTVDIFSVNLFSHVVECERAAREIYRIYPKKGSVWALYRDRNSGEGEGRCYDIVVFLTSFSELYGLSMAYLKKVEGFKTIFRRQEIGCHAISCLEKGEIKLFSHQIPARKTSDIEGVDLPKDCWELDPASLPPDLL